MWWRRFLYGSVVLGAFVFYLFNGQWTAWIILMVTLFLPWVSLILSLPSMCLTKIQLQCPERVSMNTPVSVGLTTECPLPSPPVEWKFRACETFSGKSMIFRGNASFLADHCGSIDITLKKAYIYDYLGLCAFPIGRKLKKTLLVMPTVVPVSDPPDLSSYYSATWKPKPGGGFSETYDLREYVPGDDLRQIHWKLASKTGKIILREPTIAIRKPLILTIELQGTPDELDRKLGRARYLAEYLLDKDLPFEICCGHRDGITSAFVEDREAFSKVLDTFLHLTPGDGEVVFTLSSPYYAIGGEADES